MSEIPMYPDEERDEVKRGLNAMADRLMRERDAALLRAETAEDKITHLTQERDEARGAAEAAEKECAELLKDLGCVAGMTRGISTKGTP